MHQGRMPEGPRGGLLASRWDGELPGISVFPTMRGVVALRGEMVSPCQLLTAGR
jgi:hypothetical protein